MGFLDSAVGDEDKGVREAKEFLRKRRAIKKLNIGGVRLAKIPLDSAFDKVNLWNDIAVASSVLSSKGSIDGLKLPTAKREKIITTRIDDPEDPLVEVFGFRRTLKDEKLKSIQEVNDEPLDELREVLGFSHSRKKSIPIKFA